MKGKVYFYKIIKRRIEMDITQKEVAKKIGVFLSVIKALETERSNILLKLLKN